MNLNSEKTVSEPGQIDTRTQILEAAGAVFASVGFRDATVREICHRAGVNIAAVNYHFGDKETLYREVLRYSQTLAFTQYPPLLEVSPEAPPEERLRAFLHSWLLRTFSPGAIAWHGQLISREMVDPTGVLDEIVRDKIHPLSVQLRGIVGEILGRPPGDEAVRLCTLSIVGQCVFYHHCRPVLTRLFPQQPPLDTLGTERLADHITRFSLAAMRHLAAPATV